MKVLKIVAYTTSIVVFSICLYVFLLGDGLIDSLLQGKLNLSAFRNDPMSWYFLAKGMFCSLSLYLSVTLIEAIHGLKNALVRTVQPITQAAVNTTPPPVAVAPTLTTAVPTSDEKSWYKARQGVGH